MTARSIRDIVQALEVTEGAGVTVHRTIGTPRLRHLDPFLMLDHFSSDDPDSYIAGFPDHPHRGFCTFTYMLDGHMEHRDSMGNTGDLQAGGGQWMKAASGVIHSEMPKQTAGLMRGFQLWINLPAREKMSAPTYQEFQADRFPIVDKDGARIKVIIGSCNATAAPINDPDTQVQYLDVTLAAAGHFSHALPATLQGFIYVFEGQAAVDSHALPRHTFAVLGDGDQLRVDAGPQGARFILVAGKPLGEPIVQYGPFVMNTQEEIRQAFTDYHNGTLVQRKADVNP